MSNAAVRILVTGADGFVGRHLISALRHEGDRHKTPLQIFAAVRSSASSLPSLPVLEVQGWNGSDENGRITPVSLDITRERDVNAVIERVQPQQIYHLAARAGGAEKDRNAVFAVNVSGTRLLLEAASQLSPFPRTLLVSTGYVYGSVERNCPAREEDTIGPLWRYGAYTDSKIEMESVGRAYRGFALTARPFAHTGPGQLPTFAIPAFARQMARIERGLELPELHVGNLDALRDVLDVRDVVQAYLALMARGLPGETYNIATGQPVTMRCILEQLREGSAVPTTVKVDPTRLRPADIACSTGDTAKLHTLTEWKPRFTLKQTLRDTLEYWRAITGER